MADKSWLGGIWEALTGTPEDKGFAVDPAKERIRLQHNAMEPAVLQELPIDAYDNPILKALSEPEKRQYVEMSGIGRGNRGYNAPVEEIMWSSDPANVFSAAGADENTRNQLAMEVMRAMNDVSNTSLYDRVLEGDQPRVSFIDRLISPENRNGTIMHELTHGYLADTGRSKDLTGREDEALVRMLDTLYSDEDTKQRALQYLRALNLDADERSNVMGVFDALKRDLANGNN